MYAIFNPRIPAIFDVETPARSVPSNSIEPATMRPPSGRRRKHRPGGLRLARAGLADEAVDLAAVDRERNVLDDRLRRSVVLSVADGQVLHLEQHLGVVETALVVVPDDRLRA